MSLRLRGFCQALLCCESVASGSAQRLLDRVLARVDGAPVTLTDVQAALGLGLIRVPAGIGSGSRRTQQMIDRQLELVEVQRFPPPEPDRASVTREIDPPEDECRRAAAGVDAVDGSERGSASTTLRATTCASRGYLDQRFGTAVQVSDEEVTAYYRTHEAEFTRGGDVVPFEEVEPAARQRASERAPPCDHRSVDTRPPQSRRCLDQSATNRQPITTNELRHQHRRSRRLSELEILVRLHGILHRIPLVDVDLHLAGLDDVEEIGGQRDQVLARGTVRLQ